MNTRLLICGLTAALVASSACSPASNAPENKPATATATPATAATPAAPATNSAAQDFTIVNSTGVEIDKVFVSPHDSDDWEEDILGQDTLPDGDSVDVKFNRAETAPMWDLRVEDSKGNSIEWENLNLLQISKVTLTYKEGKATARTE